VSQFEPEDFFAGIATHTHATPLTPYFLIQQWQQCQGIIIAGLPNPITPLLWCDRATFQNSKMAGAGGGTIPVRNYADLNPILFLPMT